MVIYNHFSNKRLFLLEIELITVVEFEDIEIIINF